MVKDTCDDGHGHLNGWYSYVEQELEIGTADNN